MRGNHPLWAELAWRLRTVSCSECSLSMKLGDRDLTALRDRLMEARVRVDTLIGPAAGPFNANAQTRTVPFSLSRIIYGQVGQGALRAGRHEIAARYAEWEIIGPPEIRDVDPGARYFMEGPAARGAMRISERAPQIIRIWKGRRRLTRPGAFLINVFLTRYVTYCARRRRFREMQGAARLLAVLCASIADCFVLTFRAIARASKPEWSELACR